MYAHYSREADISRAKREVFALEMVWPGDEFSGEISFWCAQRMEVNRSVINAWRAAI